MTTPDTEKLLAKLAKDVGFVYITDSNIGWAGNYKSNLAVYDKQVMINTLKQMMEEIKTMTDFNPQDRWEAGFDEAIYAVIVRIKEQMQNIVKETEN